jgi:transposase InsO family protein
VEPDLRDAVIDFVTHWSERTELPIKSFLSGLELQASKYHSWKNRYGKENFHNGKIARDHWLEDWEREAIVKFAREYPREHYRALTYRMLDGDIVAASPATVYRVLKAFDMIPSPWSNAKTSTKGKGFTQPLFPHEHWHTDVSYLNICGTFYYLITVLDGFSRYVLHWDIRESMTECDIELVLQRAHELFPNARPRIISDNGPQFIARDFKHFIRLSGMSHVRTSPNYPQSNGKLERYHRTLKSEALRPASPLTIDAARAVVQRFVQTYNCERLHSAIGFVTPRDKMLGKDIGIFAARDRKLEAARARRKAVREAHTSTNFINNGSEYSLAAKTVNSIFH